MAVNPQSKRWCLTVFDDAWIPTFNAEAVFAVWQRELCPDTGRLHVHVYVRFSTRKKMTTVKNYFQRQDAHCEITQGSEEQATAYCEKEESRSEAGSRWNPQNYNPNEGKQGRRSDLDDIATKCKEGVSIAAIAEAHPGDFIRYHSGIQALHATVAPKPPAEREVSVIVMWGATGTGKTHLVMHAFPDCYAVKLGRDPWGMYRGEDCVFFDEFDWTKWPLQDMNRYLDKWRCLLDSRYHDRYAAWTRVVICMNDSPVTLYSEGVSWPLVLAFRRRIASSCYLRTSQEQELAEMEQTPNFEPQPENQ